MERDGVESGMYTEGGEQENRKQIKMFREECRGTNLTDG